MDAAERQPETADRAVAETTDAAGTPARQRWRFQYSLASLMWATTVAACLAAMFAMYRRLERAEAEAQTARAEVRKYRDEMGYLEISDRKKIFVRCIRDSGAEAWSWRLYLPEARKFTLRMATSQIPAKGLPFCNGSFQEMKTGELVVRASAEEARGGTRQLYVSFAKAGGSCQRGGGWVIPRWPHAYYTDIAGVSQESFATEHPVVLLRVRSENCDGVMIWIEEKK